MGCLTFGENCLPKQNTKITRKQQYTFKWIFALTSLWLMYLLYTQQK